MSTIDDDLDTVSLLQAMYPLPEELVLDAETERYVSSPSLPTPSALSMTLKLPLDGEHPDKTLEIALTISRGHVKLNPRQPAWLNRTAYQTLVSSVPPQHPEVLSSEYIIESIESLRSTAGGLLVDDAAAAVEAPEDTPEEERLERVWFWFPMLSTREKRKDLVQYAPRYGLTGFVLAGKPALLCLEGDGRKVEKYMSDIKSVSWGDIPSFQKKVTERFRRTLQPGTRAFTEMTDITNEITHYGQYNHRGDMGDVRRLMEKWGVGEDFGAAVLNSNG